MGLEHLFYHSGEALRRVQYMLYQKNSPLKSHFDETLSTLVETGHRQHHIATYVGGSKSEPMPSYRKIRAARTKIRPIALFQIAAAFYILICGGLAGSISCLLECLVAQKKISDRIRGAIRFVLVFFGVNRSAITS